MPDRPTAEFRSQKPAVRRASNLAFRLREVLHLAVNRCKTKVDDSYRVCSRAIGHPGDRDCETYSAVDSGTAFSFSASALAASFAFCASALAASFAFFASNLAAFFAAFASSFSFFAASFASAFACFAAAFSASLQLFGFCLHSLCGCVFSHLCIRCRCRLIHHWIISQDCCFCQ